MPALPNVPSVVRITHKFSLGADIDVVNRYFQQYTGAPNSLSNTGAAAWALAAGNAWSSHLAPHLSTGITQTEVTVEDLSSPTGGTGTAVTSGTGGESGNQVPAGVALIIKAEILRRYRGGHPKQYIAGFIDSHLATQQTWDGTFLATFVTAYLAFRAAAAGGVPGGLSPAVDVNVSYYEGFTNFTYPSGRTRPRPTLRGTPLVDNIETFTGNPKIGSQRRRYLQSS